ncbi:hypothetical protein PVK06_034113 [Gossypium arboreum]|uniref:Uncharacterized protein n=1 Tax=Gossypium arboreum TaxID=29729 RepID=A0ABR0ND93_GOSAR|nr:hypothetical protein PVK06_034113 [Gossypium arboreum]
MATEIVVINDKPEGKVKKAKESEKKLVECFLCHGSHRLQNYPKKSVIRGDDGSDKAPKRLGLGARGVEAKWAKRNKRN